MKLNIYGIRDTLASETNLILTEKNDEMFKRTCKALLLDKRPNPINSNTKDTQVFCIGVLDTELGSIETMQPRFAFAVEQLRIELVAEIRAHKDSLGEKVNGSEDIPINEKPTEN